MKLIRQNKGQKVCAKAIIDMVRDGKEALIPYNEVMESSRVSIEVANSLRR
jgi:hypothetical protein